MPDLGEDELSLLLARSFESKTSVFSILREGQAMIAGGGVEAGIADVLTSCRPAEKRLKGQVHPFEDILHDLSIDFCQIRTHLPACGQFGTLVCEPKGDARHAVRVSP